MGGGVPNTRERARRRSVPWLTDGIFISCLYNPSLVADYKRLRNRVVSALHDAKKSYFLQLNSGDYKQFWKTIEFLSKHPPSHHMPALQAHARKSDIPQQMNPLLSRLQESGVMVEPSS